MVADADCRAVAAPRIDDWAPVATGLAKRSKGAFKRLLGGKAKSPGISARAYG
jgi:hypothetical protein